MEKQKGRGAGASKKGTVRSRTQNTLLSSRATTSRLQWVAEHSRAFGGPSERSSTPADSALLYTLKPCRIRRKDLPSLEAKCLIHSISLSSYNAQDLALPGRALGQPGDSCIRTACDKEKCKVLGCPEVGGDQSSPGDLRRGYRPGALRPVPSSGGSGYSSKRVAAVLLSLTHQYTQ